MTYVKAFQAIHYNSEKIQDISQVVCPPYDVISSEAQVGYHQAHPYNFIRILLGLDKPTDNSRDNKYVRAKKIFTEWLKKGILVQDSQPCFYIYKQEYKVYGQHKGRIGFLGLMKLQDDQKAKIFPHENTHAKAKQDRLRLWRNVKANLSPIFVCYSDRYKRIEQIFYDFIDRQDPFMNICDNDGVCHKMWRLQDPSLIKRIKDLMEDQALFIADGHHRYEVGLEYRRLRLKQRKKITGKESFNYIMTYFTNLESRDLVIFPIHRVLKKFPINKIDFLEKFFRIDRIKSVEELKIFLNKAGKNEHAFGLYSKEAIKLLRLKNRMLIQEHIHEGSVEFRHLDATILKTFVFDPLGISTDQIIYMKDLGESVRMVEENKAVACFAMNPVGIDQLKAVALNGEKMPPKTTYFYPKVLSGLTINSLDS